MKRILSLLLTGAMLLTMAAPVCALETTGAGTLTDTAYLDHIVIPSAEDPTTPSTPTIPTTPSQPETPAKTYKATRSNMMISIDGESVKPAGYAVEGYTYFKLRDVAYLMRGKACAFAVGWDQPSYSVTMTTGLDYTPAGGELAAESASTATAKVGDCNLLLNGRPISLEGYLINNNNYFKLRDIGDALGFAVDYDDATRTILINTAPVPAPEPEPEPEPEPDAPEEPVEEDPFDRTVHLDGKLKIVLDAGHGGSDGGTTGKASMDFGGPEGDVLAGDAIYEKDFNLAVALRLRDLLEEEDVEVVMIREEDETVSSSDRVELLKEYGADADMIFSIHHNSANGTAAGAELLAQIRFEEDGAPFADYYQTEVEAAGHTLRRTVYKHGDNGDYYFVLRAAASVGCLAFISEYCFLDNPKDQQWVFGEDALDAEAETLFNAIMNYFADYEY